MKNLILSLAAALVIMTGFTSCKLLSGLFGEDTVVTTPSQLVEGAEMEPVPLETLKQRDGDWPWKCCLAEI